MQTQLQSILAASGNRITEPRTIVFEYLQNTQGPASIQDIIATCYSIDRVSVYRTLELFRSLSIVVAIPSGWKNHYELTEPFKRHHHHIQCRRCNALVDIQSEKLEEFIESIAKTHTYTVDEHTFEIRGHCARCRQS